MAHKYPILLQEMSLLFVCFRTVLLSIISLLNEPNTYSPANVDASVMYRKWRDSHGKDKEYENIIRFVGMYNVQENLYKERRFRLEDLL